MTGVQTCALPIFVSKAAVVTEAIEGERAEDCLVPCTIAVKLSEAAKCVRCWNHDGHVGEDAEHPELCPRCARVVRNALPFS